MAKTDTTLTVGFKGDKGDLRQLVKDLKKTGDMAGISNQTVNKRFKQPLGKIRGELGEFSKSMEASNARVIAFGASTAVLAGMAAALRGVAKSSIEVEKALADINVILNTTQKGLSKFGSELFKIAANTGQSFQVVAEAAAELARQGLGMEQTLQRTSDALILARLSGMDTVDAVNSLTAAINSFSKSALTSTEIVNKLANVDAAFAVSSADLAEAIKRVGSSASDAGVTMDQLIAIVTTAQQTTARGGAVIGNSFKTIFTRLQRPAVLEQLNQLGVATQDAQGNIKPLIGVLQGLAKNFDTLEDVQKSQVAELVGGVFQVNVLKAALSDLGQEYSVYGRALDTSISSTDEAIKRNEQLNQTLSSLINRTFVNLQNVGSQIGDIGFAPQATNILSSLNKQIEGTDLKAGEDFGDKFGRGIIKGLGNFFLGGPGLIVGAMGIFKLLKQLKEFGADAFKSLTGLNAGAKRREDIQARIHALLKEEPILLDAIKSGNHSAAEAANALAAAYNSQHNALTKINKLTNAASGKLGGTNIAKDAGKSSSFASGFIPNLSGSAQERLAMLAAGYNPSDVRTASVRKARIYDGSGGSASSYVNSKETVRTGTNAAGYRATFVVPPKSSAAYGNYVKNIPNFAKIDPRTLNLGDPRLANIKANETTDTGKQIAAALGLGTRGLNKYGGARNIAAALRQHRFPKQTGFEVSSGKDQAAVNAVLKKYGIKGPLNVSALAFADVQGPIQKGALNMVGTPFNLAGFHSAFNSGYTPFISGVAKGATQGSDPKTAKAFINKLKGMTSNDNVGNAQVRGRVHEVIASALLKNPAEMGSKLIDIGEGANVDRQFTGLTSKSFRKGLKSGGVELKGGTFRMRDVLGKYGLKDKQQESFLDELRGLGVDTSTGGPFRKYSLGGKTFTGASGFIPNFSAKSRAMATEKAMGGSPEFRMLPFPHVADRKTQKNWAAVMRDHPEGIGQAAKNSLAMQGVPNFAKGGKDGGLMKSLGLDAMMASLFTPRATRDIAASNQKLEKLNNTIDAIGKAASKAATKQSQYKKALASGQAADFQAAGINPSKVLSSGKVDKRSKEFRGMKDLHARSVSMEQKFRQRLVNTKGQRKAQQDKLDAAEIKERKGERIRGKALGASFMIPMLSGPLIEMFTDDASPANKAANDFATGLGTASMALMAVPGPAGMWAAGLIAGASALGSFTNWFANVGDGLADKAGTMKASLQNLQDASSRYFDVSSKLDAAIVSGESGDVISRLSSKLAETLSELDPAQQALVSSSQSLTEKQDAMGKVIDQQAQKLAKVEIASSLAEGINSARGMGVQSFFQGLGLGSTKGLLFGGSFTEGANDITSVDGKNASGIATSIFAALDKKEMMKASRAGVGAQAQDKFSEGNFLNTLQDLGAGGDLITMLGTLNDESLEAVRMTIKRITQEADRNTKVAAENVKVQQQYNALIGQATKAQQEAADNLVHMQKRLVDNFVFNREMQSNKIFNQIDVNIAKFDALYGAAAQNLNEFEKADINFRKKRLDAEITFQKQITSSQNEFIREASELASISTGISKSPTSKKASTRRSLAATETSKDFTDALRDFSKTQDMNAFTEKIDQILTGQGDKSQESRRKLELAAVKQTQEQSKLIVAQEKQIEIAEQIRDIEYKQADLLKGGGASMVLDPSAFDKLRGGLVDSMEDIFLGRGGFHGAAGVDDLQAGSGFLNVIKSLRQQGFDTSAMAQTNPGLRDQAIRARQQQNFAIADDLRTLGQATGDASLTALANQLMDPKLAATQIDDYLDAGKAAREEQEAIEALIKAQGETFKTGSDDIASILRENVKNQDVTFKKLDDASMELDEAAAALYRIEVLRKTDTTAASIAKEASKRSFSDNKTLAAENARAAASDFGSFSAAGVFGQLGGMGLTSATAGTLSDAAKLTKLLGGATDYTGGASDLLKEGKLGYESVNKRNFASAFGNEQFMEALAKAVVKTGGTISDVASGTRMPDNFSQVIAQEMMAVGLAAGTSEETLTRLLSNSLFSADPNDLGSRVNSIKILQTMSADGNASAKETLITLTNMVKELRNIEINTKKEADLIQKRDESLGDLQERERTSGVKISDNLDRIQEGAARSLVESGTVESISDAFKVGKGIFTEAKTSITTPFVDAINKLKDSPIEVSLPEQKVTITGGEELLAGVKDAASAAVAESVVKAIGQMAGMLGGVNDAIDTIKGVMPAQTKQMLDNIRVQGKYWSESPFNKQLLPNTGAPKRRVGGGAF
jgi:TP901 family phage tail tape measure protein